MAAARRFALTALCARCTVQRRIEPHHVQLAALHPFYLRVAVDREHALAGRSLPMASPPLALVRHGADGYCLQQTGALGGAGGAFHCFHVAAPPPPAADHRVQCAPLVCIREEPTAGLAARIW